MHIMRIVFADGETEHFGHYDDDEINELMEKAVEATGVLVIRRLRNGSFAGRGIYPLCNIKKIEVI